MKSIYLVSVLLAFLLVSCGPVSPTVTSTPLPTSIPSVAWEEEEYKVYAELLNETTSVEASHWYTHQPIQEIIIYDHTTLGRYPGHKWSWGDGSTPSFEKVKEEATLLEPATWDDFSTKNTLDYKLDHCIHFKLDCRLISLEEYRSALADDDLKGFFKRYPNSQGIDIFSRVGFNTTMTQALVCHTRDTFMSETGGGFCYLFEKVNGEWKLRQSAMIWIS